MSQESKSVFELSPKRRALLEAMLRAEGFAPVPGQPSREAESRSSSNEAPRIERVVWQGAVPLSYAQQRLWFMQSLAPESTSWHMPIVVRLGGSLDIPALVRAVHDLMVLHETLRTTVIEQDGEPSQIVLPDNGLCVVDLEAVAGTTGLEDAQTFIQQVIETRFKFGHDALARAAIFRLSHNDHVLVFVLHHIIADGWSVTALQNSLAQAYNHALTGIGAGISPLPVQFSDFVWWERQRLSSPLWAKQLDYWEGKLRNTPVLRLPFRGSDTLGPVTQERYTFVLTDRLSEALSDFCHAQRVTPFSLLLAALHAALARATRQTDFGIGVPVSNRSQLQLEGLIAPLLNTVVLRTPFDPSLSAKAWVRCVNQNLIDAMDHRDLPFQQVIERLRPDRSLEHSPVFQVMASMGTAPALKSQLLPGLVTDFIRAGAPSLEVDLILSLAETPQGLTGSFEFDAAKFDAESLSRFAELFLHLIEQMVSEPETALRNLSLLPVERRAQLKASAQREPESLSGTWVEDRILEQAKERPGAVALKQANRIVTYGDLAFQSERLAQRLRKAGVGADDLVAIRIGRLPELVVVMLGVLRSGAAYILLDTASPPHRQDQILTDADCCFLLTEADMADDDLPCHVQRLRSPRWAWEALESGTPLRDPPQPDNFAHAVYSSENTAAPGGVRVSRSALADDVCGILEAYDFIAGDQVFPLANALIDGGINSLIAPLCAGSTIVLPSDSQENPLAETLRSCHEKDITVLSVTTLYWKEIVAHLGLPGFALPAALRLVITTGERLPLHCLRRWQEHVGREVRLVNGNGSTCMSLEVTSVTAKNFERERPGVEYAPVGLTLPYCRAYVLDQYLDLCPPGLIGELYIGGITNARAYPNAPELAAVSYLPDPYGTVPGARMYRSGELACRLASGRYEVVTRIKDCLTVRGFRLEPEEVRTALLQYKDVKDAIVLPRVEESVPQLIAYVLSESGRKIPYTDFVHYLHNRIPDYMMPSRVICLKEFPRAENGEIDRQVLAASGAREDFTAGRRELTVVEAIMSILWEEVLDQPEIGRDDNFFDLGGQSLSALRLALRIQEAFGVEVSPQTLFDSPTLRGMARKVEEASSSGIESPSGVLAVQYEGVTPLSFGQERLWFLDQLSGGAQYNIPAGLRLRGDLDAAALEQSLQYLVRRHGALRSAFHSDTRGGAVVRVETESEFKLAQADLRLLSEAARESKARELMEEEARRPFRLDTPPLLRGLLIRLAAAEHYLVMTLHHIAGDAWSAGVLVRDLGEAYSAYSAGREPQLPELETDYGEYSRWQRARVSGEFLRGQLAYWGEQLAGAEALRLPQRRGAVGTSGTGPVPSAAGGQVKRVLSEELSGRLRQLGRAEVATPFMVLLAGWQLLLGRLSGQSDVTVATPFSNRPRREWESVVGFFVNTLVLRARLHLGDTFRELVRQVRGTCLGAYAHQELPFERLMEELAAGRDMARQPLFQAMFVMQNAELGEMNLVGLKSEALEVATGTAKVELNLQAVEGSGGTGLLLEYSRDLLDEAGAEQLLARFEALLKQVCESPDSKLESLPWVDEVQTDQEPAVVARPPDRSARSMHRERSIGATFRRVVAQHGPRVAVQTETATVTYRELAERADSISRALVERCGTGVGQVALLCGRGADMIASILGSLLANKTYIALDPLWPIKRIKTILADAQADAILFEPAFRKQALEASLEETIGLDVAEILARTSVIPLTDAVEPDQLAYILYTSGSTGVPKGVMQSHRNVLTHIENYANGLRLSCDDRLTLFPSYCYDAAVMDIFGALFSGAALYPLDASAMESEELVSRIQEAQLTVLHVTPTVFRHLLRGAGEAAQFASVRAVVLGGEEAGSDILPLFKDHFSSDCILINGLGPTECTLALQHYCTGSSPVSGKLPIGTPVDGIQVQLVDEDNRPGALEGEIVLSGEQLASGYWRRADITAEFFSPEGEGRRAYHTGDLGRLLSDGNIEYIGRKDFQVKIQGSRVEIYEIEAALAKVSGVVSAVVVVADQRAEKQLLAYYTSTDELAEDEIRNELATYLPRYMLPARFISVPEIPMLPNGKVDRLALLNRDEGPLASHSFKLPRTWLERALVEIWQQVLNTRPISIDDNFFALGGHSLLALRLLSTVFRTLGCRLPIAALFEAPTIESMALRIAAAQGNRQDSALVCMQPQGARPPIFLVHPAGGDVLCFRHLTIALGTGQPAYGLQDPTIASGDPPMTSIPEIASTYLRAVRTVRPQGPWVFGGWSFGGVVAFEMCRQLSAAGEVVAALMLFDSRAPGQVTQALPLDDAFLLAFIARADFNVEVDVKDLESRTLDEQIAFVSDLTGATARSREYVESQLFRARDILHARRVALRSYDPGSYDGPVTLFRAAERDLQQGPDYVDYPDNGWSGLCSGSLEIVSVSGNHTTMAEPPNVETLSREISVRLDAIFSVQESVLTAEQ